jgi:hypothetical protein
MNECRAARAPDDQQRRRRLPGRPPPVHLLDFTGLGAPVTRPTGEYSIPIQGCLGTDQAHWLAVNFDATTPPDTAVEIDERAGDDLATLNQQTLYGPWTVSPADLQVPRGRCPTRATSWWSSACSADANPPIVHGFADWAWRAGD